MPDDGRAGHATPGRWPLSGRRDQLEVVAAALDDPAIAGVLFHGPAGVGKSRLADESLRAAVGRGRVGARVVGSSGSSAVPLGALAPLLPAGIGARAADPAALYAAVAEVLRERSPDQPFVVLVDDLPLIDVTSATLLGQLLTADVVFLLGTVRTGTPVPPAIGELSRREQVARVDLDALTEEAVDTLLHLALGGPVAGATVEHIWRASQGNPLFVRELILGARATGTLEDHGGVWTLTGDLQGTPLLTEIIESRIGALEPPLRAALDRLAVTEPTGLADLAEGADPVVLEALEGLGLLEVTVDRRREEVRLAHPLHGEVIRAGMPSLTRRRLLLEHADRIERHGARRREDPLRIALARLDATGSADVDALLTGARLARYGHDFPQVVRLASAALDQQPSDEASVLLAEALHELGRYEEADAVLARALPATGPIAGEVAVSLVASRIRTLVFGLRRIEDALALAADALERAADPDSVDQLLTDRALALLYDGYPLDAIDTFAAMSPEPSLRARVLRAINLAPALSLAGRCEQALAVSTRALAEHEQLGDQVAIAHPAIHHVFRAHALTEAGQLAAAGAIYQAGTDATTDGGPPIGRVWWLMGVGRVALLSGRPLTAIRALSEAASLCRVHDFVGPLRWTLALQAVAHGWRGEVAPATAAADAADALPPYRFSGPEQRLGRAWALVAAGQTAHGRAVLLDAASDAADRGHGAAEAWLLHDVVRLGDPGAAHERLATVAAASESELVGLYAAHAAAAHAHDPDALAEVADRLASTGADLFAAEVLSEAATEHRRRGETRESARRRTAAAALLAGCEGARTPALLTTDAVVPLTAREREVAVLAAERVPSKEIAERLFLSVRTVDNHLRNVYTKLGVTTRRELAESLAATPEPS